MGTNSLLDGKTGLITGFANRDSIAFGCARAAFGHGAELICSYGHPKAAPHVEPLASELGDAPMRFCDVRDPASMAALFAEVEQRWGRLDFLVHSIAFAPLEDLHGRVVDCSRDGFLTAMDISCYSFLEMARYAEPLMRNGGTLMTLSYYGAEKVIDNYNIMGPVKAALESSVRYLAHELGPAGIRVHALSPGPIATRAASGIKGFAQMQQQVAARAPTGKLATIDDVGQLAAFLASDAAAAMTGSTLYIDGGFHTTG